MVRGEAQMNCKSVQRNIYKWLEGRLVKEKREDFKSHLLECAGCHKEVQSAKRLENLLQVSDSSIEPSPEFEANFWTKVFAREKEPRFSRLLRDFESLIPVPTFSQAFVILLIALFMGGAGGAVSAMNTLTPERIQSASTSIQYLSGFHEFKGLPSSAVSAAYLKTVEESGIS